MQFMPCFTILLFCGASFRPNGSTSRQVRTSQNPGFEEQIRDCATQGARDRASRLPRDFRHGPESRLKCCDAVPARAGTFRETPVQDNAAAETSWAMRMAM